MAIHKCKCSFVPTKVLENAAKSGIKGARLSLQQSKLSRTKRSDKLIGLSMFAGSRADEQGSRVVYDCKNKWEQRVTKVRGENDPPTSDQAVNTVYDYADVVREYLITQLERNSIDNQGMDLILNVHYGVDYMNAFWDGDEMTFGDGDGKIFSSFTKSLDVVAHELAHGITQYTADLEYQSQSGALNEHFSDVIGTVITQYHQGQSAHDADWLIGDEIMGPDLYGEALRSMKAPGTAYNNDILGKDPQPDHMDNYFVGSEDNYGVHINSGIPNKAFYLVAMTIGTDKAAHIWYHALQNLWSTANFNDAVDVIANSARILTKEEKVPLGSTQTVRSAFKEVGLPR